VRGVIVRGAFSRFLDLSGRRTFRLRIHETLREFASKRISLVYTRCSSLCYGNTSGNDALILLNNSILRSLPPSPPRSSCFSMKRQFALVIVVNNYSRFRAHLQILASPFMFSIQTAPRESLCALLSRNINYVSHNFCFPINSLRCVAKLKQL